MNLPWRIAFEAKRKTGIMQPLGLLWVFTLISINSVARCKEMRQMRSIINIHETTCKRMLKNCKPCHFFVALAGDVKIATCAVYPYKRWTCAIYFVKLYKTSRAMGNAKRELIMVIRKCVDFFSGRKEHGRSMKWHSALLNDSTSST